MARIACEPINEKAAAQASSDFYSNHPEMVQHGRRIPIDPCNTQHVKYQTEWMNAYEKHGGHTYQGKYTPPCAKVTAPCPCDGRLQVRVGIQRGFALFDYVPEALVRVMGATEAEGQTNEQGVVSFTGLQAGFHVIDVAEARGTVTETVVIACHELTDVTVWLTPHVEKNTKLVAKQWFRRTSISVVMRGSGGRGGVEPTERNWSVTIIEKYEEVPQNHELVDAKCDQHLAFKAPGMFSLGHRVERSSGVYGEKTTGQTAWEFTKKVAEGGASDNLYEAAANALSAALKAATDSSKDKYGLSESPTNQVFTSWEEAQAKMHPVDFAEITPYR